MLSLATTMTYKTTIGLEIHAELSTRTKMFCTCKNDPEEKEPNTHVCPVCLAHPGTLPTVNRKAVENVLRVGAAIGGNFSSDYSEFDRKSYFYPDIPKGYQISQYEYPFISGGSLIGIPITRIHLEEDTARSIHSDTESLVDFNRAGVPLMELVTEPEIHDAETAGHFARELQLLLRTLGVSKANLEKGEMRIEANISVSKDDTLGTKVEVKNLNSFRSVERAIEFEVKRQIEVIEKGEEIQQATRGWDENKQNTFHQRVKEDGADYRYFPEPDIPKVVLFEMEDMLPDIIKNTLPELPEQRRTRYCTDYQLKKGDVEYLIETGIRTEFFDAVTRALKGDTALVQRAVNYIVSDLAGWYAKNGGEEYVNIKPEMFAKAIQMTTKGRLSSRGAKEVLALMAEKGGDPEDLASAHSLLQTQDRDTLLGIVDTVISENTSVVDEFRGGKEPVLQFLIGQCMKLSCGSGNPGVFKELLVERIS